jgi:hypothetical protein
MNKRLPFSVSLEALVIFYIIPPVHTVILIIDNFKINKTMKKGAPVAAAAPA